MVHEEQALHDGGGDAAGVDDFAGGFRNREGVGETVFGKKETAKRVTHEKIFAG